LREQIVKAIKLANHKTQKIKLNPSVSKHLAQKWICEPFNLPTWDTPIGMDNNLDMASAYYFFGNAINFGFSPERDSLGPVGNIHFWLTLRSHPELLEPVNLTQITANQLSDIFGPLSLPEERATIWRETARALRLKYNGTVTELYEANHWNAPEIVQAMSKDFPGFRDAINGVPFLRRAQLTLFMTHARFQDSMLFTNLDRLSVGSDLQVFNGLLQLGVIEIEPEIIQSLMDGFIPPESELEFEIRCWTILSSEILLSDINALRKDKITTCQLDYLLRQVGTNGRAPLPLAHTTSY